MWDSVIKCLGRKTKVYNIFFTPGNCSNERLICKITAQEAYYLIVNSIDLARRFRILATFLGFFSKKNVGSSYDTAM